MKKKKTVVSDCQHEHMFQFASLALIMRKVFSTVTCLRKGCLIHCGRIVVVVDRTINKTRKGADLFLLRRTNKDYCICAVIHLLYRI